MNRRAMLKYAAITSSALVLSQQLPIPLKTTKSFAATSANPTIRPKTNFTVDKNRCIQCETCAQECPRSIIVLNDHPTQSDEAKCLQCLHCFAVCPQGAISILGNHPDNATPIKDNLPSFDKLNTLYKGRRAVRNYQDTNLDKELITTLVNSASNAPTGRNSKELLFTVIDNRLDMERLRNRVMDKLISAVEKNQLADHPKRDAFQQIAAYWKNTGNDFIFKGAPHMLITSSPLNSVDTPHPQQDTIIALTYFEILAQSSGVGTLWNSLAKAAIDELFPETKQELGIPENHHIGWTMSFGMPFHTYHRTIQKRPALINRAQLTT